MEIQRPLSQNQSHSRPWHYNLLAGLFNSWKTTLSTIIFYPYIISKIDSALHGNQKRLQQILNFIISTFCYFSLIFIIYTYPLQVKIDDDYQFHENFLTQNAEHGIERPEGYEKRCNVTHHICHRGKCGECAFFKAAHHRVSFLGKIMYPITAVLVLWQIYIVFSQVAKTRAFLKIRGSTKMDLCKVIFCCFCTTVQVGNEHEVFSA